MSQTIGRLSHAARPRIWYSSRMNSSLETPLPLPNRLRSTPMIAPRLAGRAIIVTSLALLVAPIAARADTVTDWNAITVETTMAATPDPALRGHTQVITQVAVFEAVNSIIGDYEPYLEKVPAPAGASPDAAAVAAAHRVLVSLHPDRTADLDAARTASLAAIPDGQPKIDGIAVGVAAADAILALRANDGFDVIVPYTPGKRPGDWQPTPPDFVPAFRPGLGQVAPFAIESGAGFRASPPPPLRSEKYARAYREVKELGDANSTSRPQDRTDVARFFAVADDDTTYYPAARQVSAAQGRTLSENGRIFALLSIAIWDSVVACFDSKYHYSTWRPITAIRAGDTDGNRRTEPDPNWEPLVPTPPFPSYPAGAPDFDAAARVILEHAFGDDGFSFELTIPQLPGVVLHYTSWDQLSEDVHDARVFGGVHYRFDNEAGAHQGKRVGEYVLRHEMRPARDRDCKPTKP